MVMIYQRKKDGKFNARYKEDNGRWVVRPTGVADREVAQQLAEQMESRALKKRHRSKE